MERKASSPPHTPVEPGGAREESPGGRSRIWFTVRLLLVVLAVAAVVRGRERIVHWKASLPEHRIDPANLALKGAPPWLTVEDIRGICRDSGLGQARLSVFTPDLGERIDAAFRRSPWVERVAHIQCGLPNRVDVYLELRFGKPLAGVPWSDGWIYLVDERGVRLPGRRKAAPRGLGRPFRLLEGVRVPPPLPGESWSPAVREGAQVASRLLELEPSVAREAAIEAVDVGNVGGRLDRLAPEIVLRGARGTLVEWGRSRLSPLGELDPDPAAKLRRLVRSLEVYQGFVGLRRVKLQFDDLIVEELGDRPLQRIPPDAHGG